MTEGTRYYERNDQYLLHIDNDLPDLIIIYDLGQYYEPFKRSGKEKVGIFPINKGGVVSQSGKTFKVDRVTVSGKGKSIKENGYDQDGHCYIFIDITEDREEHHKPFAKKPSEVSKFISDKIIIVQDFNL